MKIFSSKKRNSIGRKISLVLAIIILAEAISPTLALALTSGPSAPEFSSFEPVTTTSMVNEFTGDFSYNIPVLNIPGANGGGYALSLSYHSGESVESEASWVGYGWTLNPGAINRGKRGYADDTKNTRSYYNEVPPNWTVSTGVSIGNMEAFSYNLPLNVNASIRYNNYRGFGYTAGAGLSIRQGLVSLGYSVSDGSGSFSAAVNPAPMLAGMVYRKKQDEQKAKFKNASATAEDKMAADLSYRQIQGKQKAISKMGSLAQSASQYGMYALGDQQHPTAVTPYAGKSYNTNFNLQTNVSPIEVGPQFGFTGNFNFQKNKELDNRTAYGYLYSADAYDNESGSMDYGLEKEAMYTKRDRYMSIPFSNADGFSITGEGIGGGFRLHSHKAGRFRPNNVISKTDITQVSADISLGLHFGGGVNLGVGEQTLSVDGGAWSHQGFSQDIYTRFESREDQNVTDRKEAFFFRFNGDLGGDVNFGTDDLITARLDQDGWVAGSKSFHPTFVGYSSSMNSVIPLTDSANGSQRSGRSSYIGFHTNAEMEIPAYTYEKSNTVLVNGSIDRSSYPEQIGEISTVNEEGNRYVYGLPVNVKNETSMQYDVAGATSITNNYMVLKNISNYKRKVGEVDNGVYASTYLLTQITTPDYVDLRQDGPTPDDLGGYTKFEYERIYSATGAGGKTPYHYRMPYTGLFYNKGELSDPTDDMGSYTSGDKDVYYLKRIVTKTHTATFFTSPRADGMDAANDGDAAADNTKKGGRKLRQLNYIELRANDASKKLVKKVIFKYDNSLCTGVPNSSSGKLTLKSLWFESDGIVNVKVSPYQFKYKYPDIATTYPVRYRTALKAGYDNAVLIDSLQNPRYSNFAIDAWGNYQETVTGKARFASLKAHVNQTPPATFDPAAWQLKVIQLPSGGEIHVQYEQDDYLYVQNRRAMALVSLKNSSTTQDETGNTSGVYTLNVEDIGVSTAAEKQELVTLINEQLNDQKIYFKFLYALVGSLQTDAINACNSDYISGYVDFVTASYDSPTNTVRLTVGDNSGNSGYSLPRKVCLDMVRKQKGGKLNEFGNCNAADAGVQSGLTPKAMVQQLINKIGTSFFSANTACKEIRPALSYFRIPVLKPKKGGGLRVKRVLMYDANGIDYGPTSAQDGISALYGTEYFYQETDGKSSGVATNEPATIREENALVTFLARRSEQGLLNKAIAGMDREQFEGPIGETLLPTPSVGYGRVVAKNIHSGRTGMGFIVSEFYTVKEYPFDRVYPALNGAKGVDQSPINSDKDFLNLPAIITNINIANTWATQGYRFILNAMHGQPKSVSTCAGDFINPQAGTGPLSAYTLSSSTSYEYFEPGEKIKMGFMPNGRYTEIYPGKETELVYEMKQVQDITADASLEIDFGVGIAGIIPLPQASVSPLVNYSESKMRTLVTSRVVQYPAIQKAVVTTQDGISHRTENMIFSRYTGKPIKVKTTDGYDQLNLESSGGIQNGTYTSFTTPAYSQYREMGPKAINERYIIRPGSMPYQQNIIMNYVNADPAHTLFVKGQNGYSICDFLGLFTVGDLVRINQGSGAYFYIHAINGNKIDLFPSWYFQPGLSSASVTEIEIVKSARTNQVNAAAGQYTTYGAEKTPTLVGVDPGRKAQWDQFITALNNLIPSGGTLNAANYPLLRNSDCSALSGTITVSAETNNNISIQTNANGTNLVKNWDFTDHDPSLYSLYPNNHFYQNVVSHWVQSHGLPDYNIDDDRNGAAKLYGGSQSGVLQYISLDPYKRYTISLKATYSRNTIYVRLCNSATSGLPRVSSNNLYQLTQGQLIFQGTVPLNTPGYYSFTSNPFTPNAGNDQLVIYAAGVDGGQPPLVDSIKIIETGCTSNMYSNTMVAGNYGHFAYNESGQILYYSPDNECFPQVVPCFRFCESNPSYRRIDNVIAASAVTYSDRWSLSGGRGNPYEQGDYCKYRPQGTYVYKAPATGGSQGAERNYKAAGTFTMNFFNWKDPSLNQIDKWVRTNFVTRYTGDGAVSEEVDAMGIYSAAKYGYKGIVPYVVAKNSPYDCLKYESFENLYSYSGMTTVYRFEEATADPARHATTTAHSGSASYRIQPSSSFSFPAFKVDSRLEGKSLSLKVWVKDPTHAENPLTVYSIATSPDHSRGHWATRIAQSGDWALYEVQLGSLMLDATYYFQLYSATGADVYIDDVRQQPLEAKASAFVYDPVTLRLRTSFDDQHFGLYYRYNAEGKLTSKLMETERGMKTVAEQQYNTPKIIRP